MSEMNEFIAETTNKIFRKHISKELIDASEQGEWAKELWEVLVESGLVAVGVDEDSGGTGGDLADAFTVLRLAGKYSAPVPIFETLIAGRLLGKYRIEVDYEPTSLVVCEDTDLTLSGFTLKNVPWGRHVSRVVYIGKVDGQLKLVVFPTQKAVVEQNQNIAGEPLDHLTFNEMDSETLTQVEIDQENMYEEVWKLAALGKSAMIAGALEQVLELSVFYANERHQFGRAISRFQAIQHHLANLTSETAAVLAAVNYAIVVCEENCIAEELALTKMKSSEAAGKVSGIAHQLHGAIGMTHEHQLHHATRRLWAWREDFGNEAHWARKLANVYIENSDLTLWEFITEEKRGSSYAGFTV